MPLLEDSGPKDTPNLELRESSSCATDGGTDTLKLTLSKSGFFWV